MSKRAYKTLLQTMQRFHQREQVIQRIIHVAHLNKDGSYTVRLTAQELAILSKKAS